MLAPFLPVARQALSQPRDAADTLMSMGIPRAALWPAFFVLILLSTVLTFFSTPADAAVMPPFAFAFISALAGAISVLAIWKIGELMGGTGSFFETLLLTIFVQALLLAGQVVELGIFLVAPPIASLFSIGLIIWAFWINLNFIAALHSFSSLWRALGCLFMASFAVAILLVIVLAVVGIQLPGAA